MHLRDARWLLLSVFLVGFITCQRALGHLGPSFVALSLLDAAACAVLLTQLSRPTEQTLWAWLGLLLLLDGYFVRMFWIAHNLNRARYIDTYYVELRWVTRGRILAGYPWVSAGFVVYCVAAAAMLSLGRRPRLLSAPKRTPTLTIWRQLVACLFVGYLLASLLQFRLGFGVRGVANPSLPLHLGTIMTLSRQGIIPGLLLTALWVFDGRDRRWTTITLGCLFVCGVIDSLLSASRGQLLLLTTPVFVLWVVTGRFDLRRKLVSVIILLTAIVLVPIVSAYRAERITGTTTAGASHITVQRVMQSLFFLGDRAGDGGIDAVWFALDHRGAPSTSRIVTYLRPSALNNYYTHQIVGVRDPNDHRNSGMFGAFIIIGSGPALLVLTVGAVVLIWGLWSGLRRLQCWPVGLALGAVSVALIIADPTDAFLTVFKVLIEVAMCETVYRRLAPVERTRQTRAQGPGHKVRVAKRRPNTLENPIPTVAPAL